MKTDRCKADARRVATRCRRGGTVEVLGDVREHVHTIHFVFLLRKLRDNELRSRVSELEAFTPE